MLNKVVSIVFSCLTASAMLSSCFGSSVEKPIKMVEAGDMKNNTLNSLIDSMNNITLPEKYTFTYSYNYTLTQPGSSNVEVSASYTTEQDTLCRHSTEDIRLVTMGGVVTEKSAEYYYDSNRKALMCNTSDTGRWSPRDTGNNASYGALSIPTLYVRDITGLEMHDRNMNQDYIVTGQLSRDDTLEFLLYFPDTVTNLVEQTLKHIGSADMKLTFDASTSEIKQIEISSSAYSKDSAEAHFDLVWDIDLLSNVSVSVPKEVISE